MTGAVSGKEEKRKTLRRIRYQQQMINLFRAAVLGVGIGAIGGTLGGGTLVVAAGTIVVVVAVVGGLLVRRRYRFPSEPRD